MMLYILGDCTLDYDSFAVAILGRNHREINIAELILANRVVTEGVFNTYIINNMVTSLTGVENHCY